MQCNGNMGGIDACIDMGIDIDMSMGIDRCIISNNKSNMDASVS